MISDLHISRPNTALAQLKGIIVSSESSNESIIQLSIIMDSTDINVREFTAYLSVIDRTYGRLSRRGLLSYSKNPYSQLQTSFRQGSLEIIISELLSRSDSVTAIIVLRYLLKYLPLGLKDMATAYRDYEEGLMVRERRKQLREEIKRDQELAGLDNKRKNEIVAFLDMLYWHERRQLPAAQRFAAKYVQRILLKRRSSEDPLEEDA